MASEETVISGVAFNVRQELRDGRAPWCSRPEPAEAQKPKPLAVIDAGERLLFR